MEKRIQSLKRDIISVRTLAESCDADIAEQLLQLANEMAELVLSIERDVAGRASPKRPWQQDHV